MKALELAGQTFGRLTVLSRAPSKLGLSMWLCRCDCGNTHIANGKLMKGGHTKSCGCLRHDTKPALTHGHSPNGNMSSTYKSWSGMRQRCGNSNDKNYRYYGGKGIAVCDQWKSFDVFLKDMGERPTGLELDRIESNGNYEPTNCRWATEQTQTENRSMTLWVDVGGARIPMKHAAERLGLNYHTLRNLTAKNGKYRLSAQSAVERLLVSRRS